MVDMGGCEESRLTVLLHDGEDLDDNLGRRSDHDLSLSSSFGIDDVVLKVSLGQTYMLSSSFARSSSTRFKSMIQDIHHPPLIQVLKVKEVDSPKHR